MVFNLKKPDDIYVKVKNHKTDFQNETFITNNRKIKKLYKVEKEKWKGVMWKLRRQQCSRIVHLIIGEIMYEGKMLTKNIIRF